MSDHAIADYCIALHRRNSEQLGLIPKEKMREYVEKGQVFLAWEGGELCGYLICGLNPPWARVWQACVEYDLRGLGHGKSMVDQVTARGRAVGCIGVSLRCREGLASNWFWGALGFLIVGQVPGGSRRGKPLNVWAKRIAPDLLVGLDGLTLEAA